MGDHDRIVAAIDRIAPAFEESGLDELELEVEDLRIRMARPRVPPMVAASAVAPAAAALAAPGPESDGLTPFGEPRQGMQFVSAPLTGVWYPSPSPGARPYVNEGDEITAGQVVGLIEAMKLFNEIKADVSGTVARVLAERGTLVKRKQPLLEIDPR